MLSFFVIVIVFCLAATITFIAYPHHCILRAPWSMLTSVCGGPQSELKVTLVLDDNVTLVITQEPHTGIVGFGLDSTYQSTNVIITNITCATWVTTISPRGRSYFTARSSTKDRRGLRRESEKGD